MSEEKKTIVESTKGKIAHPADNLDRQEEVKAEDIQPIYAEHVKGGTSSPADMLCLKSVDAGRDSGTIEASTYTIPKADHSKHMRYMHGGRVIPTDHMEKGVGPGGHIADGSGPHGGGMGPGKGKKDGSGMEDDKKKKDIKKSVVVNADGDQYDREKYENKLSKTEAKNYLDGEIRRRSYFYIPSKDECESMSLEGNGDAASDYLKPKLDLKAQQVFDEIVYHAAKECDHALQGIRAVGKDWSPDYVKSIMKDFHKLKKDEMYKSMVEDLKLVKKLTPNEYEELKKAKGKKPDYKSGDFKTHQKSDWSHFNIEDHEKTMNYHNKKKDESKGKKAKEHAKIAEHHELLGNSKMKEAEWGFARIMAAEKNAKKKKAPVKIGKRGGKIVSEKGKKKTYAKKSLSTFEETFDQFKKGYMGFDALVAELKKPKKKKTKKVKKSLSVFEQELLLQKAAKSPEALAAWIGRRKYGKETYQQAAAKGKKMKGKKAKKNIEETR